MLDIAVNWVCLCTICVSRCVLVLCWLWQGEVFFKFRSCQQSFVVFLPSTLLIPEVLFWAFFYFYVFFCLFVFLPLAFVRTWAPVCCDSNSGVERWGVGGRITFCEQIYCTSNQSFIGVILSHPSCGVASCLTERRTPPRVGSKSHITRITFCHIEPQMPRNINILNKSITLHAS